MPDHTEKAGTFQEEETQRPLGGMGDGRLYERSEFVRDWIL